MGKVMMQLSFPGRKPTLEAAADSLGIDVAALDPEFGVISTDPTRHLYAVRAEAEAAEQARPALEARNPDGSEGAFGEVRIAPFGPPED